MLACSVALALLPGLAAGQSMTGGVDIQVESFGVGNVARPGSWVGIRLALTDQGASVRDVLVRLERPDADGDIESIQQTVALAPGASRGLWMYARLPFSAKNQGVQFTTIVEPIADGEQAPVAGSAKPIGSKRIGANGLYSPADSIIGVIGRRSLRLEEYAMEYQPGQGISGTLHNLTRTISGLRPIDIPDAWMGLDQFEALVWSDGDPSSLLPSQTRAIEDWVRGGGRLIVVLNAGSAAWTNARANPLFSITPETLVQRLDGVDLESVRALLTINENIRTPSEGERKGVARPMPGNETLHLFKVASDAQDTEALFNDSRGRTVAVRRTVGCGEVTMIGIDLGSTGLAGMLDAEAIWHRVLGRRGDLFSLAEMDELRKSDEGANFFHPEGVPLDDVIAGKINKIGRVGVGVLLGLIVFGLYLVLAGPVSFAALGKMGKREHSWVVFLAIAGIFTGIAWGGATVLRPAKEDITHLTLLEHVYKQPTQRAKVWFSALLPTYGSQTVSIPNEGADEFAALSNWDDPDSFSQGDFPDTRIYAVDSRRPDSLRVPTRSTVKRFEAEWVGGPRWSMIRPLENDPVHIDADGRLHGKLKHELPGPVDRVTILLVRGQTPMTSRRLGGPLLANAVAHRLTDPWEPGQAIDLSSLGAPSLAEQYFQTLASKEKGGNFGGVGSSASPAERMEMLLWHDWLEPPSWRESNTNQTFERTLRTRAAHGWGGGRWMTQPCLIIVGHIEDAPSPVPIEIDGRTPPMSGTTLLRWVHPLPSNPPKMETKKESRIESGQATEEAI